MNSLNILTDFSFLISYKVVKLEVNFYNTIYLVSLQTHHFIFILGWVLKLVCDIPSLLKIGFNT